MEKGTLSVLFVVILTLIVGIFSYFDLKSSITDNAPLVARPFITVHGVGSTVTLTLGGGNCSGSRAPIEADVAINSGGAGNVITATASCTRGTAPATATATDPGTGRSVVGSATGGAGAGVASCDTVYTGVAGAVASTWVAQCTF